MFLKNPKKIQKKSKNPSKIENKLDEVAWLVYPTLAKFQQFLRPILADLE